MRNNNFYKFVFWVYLLIVFICLASFLLSCNPVKQVLKDNNKIKQVWEAAVLDSWCVNDSVYVSDTTILLDTLHTLETLTDTIKIDSVVYITKTEYKTVTKTRDIEKKFYITDNSRINLLQKEVSKLWDDQIKLKQDIVKLEADKLSMKKDRNKWRLIVWLIIAAIAAFILRKYWMGPAGKLLGVVGKVFKAIGK